MKKEDIFGRRWDDLPDSHGKTHYYWKKIEEYEDIHREPAPLEYKEHLINRLFGKEIKESFQEGGKIDYEDLNGMLKVLGAIIGGVEKVIDQTYGENTFVKAFRSVLIDISEDFPFLDPFAAEFEYKDGEIEFVGNEDRDGFTKGIQEALLLTISNVSEGKDSEKLIAKVREELKSVLEKFPNEITGFKIDEKMKNIIEL